METARSALVEVIKASCSNRKLSVTPENFMALGRDPSDLAAVRLVVKPALRPGGWKSQHQLEILAAVEAPFVPAVASRPIPCSGQPFPRQHRTAQTAAAKCLHRCQKAIAAVCAGGSPGQVVGFMRQECVQGIQPWNGPLMSGDGAMSQIICQGHEVIQLRISLKECEPQSAEAMGAARHQPVAWTGIGTVQPQRPHATQRRD